MIDFDALVIGPCQMLFARPVMVTPVVSQPHVPAYPARGIWVSKPIDVDLAEGIMSSQAHSLDVRASEFEVPLEQGDLIDIPAHLTLPRIGVCAVEDTDDDGQGGTMVSLKVIGP